jgi:hypothetical protein
LDAATLIKSPCRDRNALSIRRTHVADASLSEVCPNISIWSVFGVLLLVGAQHRCALRARTPNAASQLVLSEDFWKRARQEFPY